MKRFSFNGFLKQRSDNQEYEVKVLGSVLCSHPGAEEICRAMGEKYTASRQRKIPCQNMTVTSKGIQLEKGLTGSEGSMKKFVIERIVYCGVDKQHKRIFGFFYRAPDNLYGGLDCHVVECRSRQDAKHIALKISEIFHQMAEEKQQDRGESSLTQLNNVRERTKSVSMVQLHSSIESLIENPDSCPASPKIEQRPNSRKLNYSELQLHGTKYENSSGYGDSSDDLTDKISSKTKRRKRRASGKAVQLNDSRRKTSQIGQVEMDYVNGEWCSHIERNNTTSTYNPNVEHETLLSSEIKEWRTSRKDKNDNSYQSKITVNQEYMNMKKIALK
jgi:hypothetical protein